MPEIHREPTKTVFSEYQQSQNVRRAAVGTFGRSGEAHFFLINKQPRNHSNPVRPTHPQHHFSFPADLAINITHLLNTYIINYFVFGMN